MREARGDKVYSRDGGKEDFIIIGFCQRTFDEAVLTNQGKRQLRQLLTVQHVK
jgi:hypothetical protein